MDPIQDVQHSLYALDAAHAAELEAPLHPHDFEYSCGLISFKSVQIIVKPLDSFYILD